MSNAVSTSRYESIPKRNFRNAIIKLCEEHYKILGSRKVLQLLADDIVQLHQEFYPDAVNRGLGSIVWAASSKKPSYGQRAEDYQVKTVLLPLISEEDIEARLVGKQAKADNQFIGQ